MNATISITTDEDKLETVKAFLKALKIKFEIAEEVEKEVPQWQIKEARKRLSNLKQNPESAIDFDDMIDGLKSKYAL